MPPPGVPRPKELDTAIQYVEGELDKADRNTRPDPGRVTARRLNRAEYTNTIRDLLAVDFRAEKSFPTDDLGNGFDNIGDVLTISPVLMEKYLSAAGEIARRAIGADPLPKKPLETATRAEGPQGPPRRSEHDRRRRRASSSTANIRSGSACPASAGKMPPR